MTLTGIGFANGSRSYRLPCSTGTYVPPLKRYKPSTVFASKCIPCPPGEFPWRVIWKYNVSIFYWTASQPDLHRPRSLLSGDDKKRDQVNELGVVLVYLRLTCSLLKIVLVKVGYFWSKLCSFLQIMSLVLKIICFAKWEKQVKKTYHDRVTILFGVTSSSSIVFGILCLKATVSGSVCWFWYGLLLQVIGRCGWRHLAKLQIMEGTVTNIT